MFIVEYPLRGFLEIKLARDDRHREFEATCDWRSNWVA